MRTWWTFIVVGCAALGWAGCATAPWSPRMTSGNAETRASASQAAGATAVASSALPATAASTTSIAQAASSATNAAANAGQAPDDATAHRAAAPDPQSMQTVIAELQQVGAMDPAAQEQLMRDLRETDPALWPLIMQQFRAAAAYRRRAEQTASAAGPNAGPNAGPAEVTGMNAAYPPSGGVVPTSYTAVSGDASAVRPAVAQTPQLPPANAVAPNATQADAISAYAGRANVAPMNGASAYGSPSNVAPVYATPTSAASVNTVPAATAPAGAVPPSALVPAAAPPAAPPPTATAQLRAAVQSMEAELQTAGHAPLAADEVRLRLAQLAAGQRAAAIVPPKSDTPAMREFWSQQMYGMATLLDTEQQPDAMLRAAEAKHFLDEAAARLGASASLMVRNLAFCTDIQSYGCYKTFPAYEFTPGQEVLLYAEIENYASDSSPQGYHTAMRSSYKIFDSRGQSVDELDLTLTEEHCRNQRRDFFIGYHLRMPKQVYPGRHTLQLTIEDVTSQKIGQSTIEFTIKPAP